jgi:hypothetical protein
MKTSPYLVILFLKILALVAVSAQNHPRVQRRPQQHPQQPQRGGRLFRDDLSKIRRNNEVFFVNLEDGFFGCQVNLDDVISLFPDLFIFFSTGISYTVPRRFLLQAGSTTTTFTRHHYHHFPFLSLKYLNLSLVCL